MREIVLIAHDIRSTHNVGSLLRTAECLGVAHVYLTGYTPYPPAINDERLPHIRDKIGQAIDKTALGAAQMIGWSQHNNVEALFGQLRNDGFSIAALEQTPDSTPLPSWRPSAKIAIVLGREVEGIAPDILQFCDMSVEIPQFGTKESLNVVQAAAMCLYQARFTPLP